METYESTPGGTKRQRFATATRQIAHRTPEWRIQAACVSALRKTGWPISVVGDMNAGRRGITASAVAKACGMTAGEPDVRIYGPHGRLLLIEYKASKGRLSAAQKERHELLAGLGHKVTTIQADNERDAITATLDLVKTWLGVTLH